MVLTTTTSLFFLFFCGLFALVGLGWRLLRRPSPFTRTSKVNIPDKPAYMRDLIQLSRHNEPASTLLHLISVDGAGDWPPRCDHDSWPQALLPYQQIYLELNSLLPHAQVSTDDQVNQNHRQIYRSLMRRFLAERVDVQKVTRLMAAAEAGNWEELSLAAYNGFYCAVAVSRHAYRWAMIPVVKVAQLEKTVEFPPELEAPWPYLQRHFGCDADAGNNTSNVVHNFNQKGERVYKINVGMSDLIQSAEDRFFRMFLDLEVQAFPIYCEMVRTIASHEAGDINACIQHLNNVNWRLRELLTTFYDGMHNSCVPRSVWLSYIQGFQGWGVGRMVNGQFVKYDGLSGNHVLFFQALDAFLGMDHYLTKEAMDQFIPRRQRDVCASFRKHSIRRELCGDEDSEVREVFTKIVKQVRVFRAAHRTRVMPYLQQPAPERLPMSAGKSLLVQGQGVNDLDGALLILDGMLVKRLNETL